MNIDSFTLTANSHAGTGTPNQDAYAIKKYNNSISIAVSDGCSSMEDAHYTSIDVARKAVEFEDVNLLINENLKDIRNELHGHATLVWANISSTEIIILMCGDGLCGFDNSALMLDWHDVPPYPTYNEDILAKWTDTCDITIIGDKYELSNKNTYYIYKIPYAGEHQFWISTDGLNKIDNLNNVVKEITALKNKNGTFLKRRLARWLKDKTILDDITVISVLTGDDNESQSMG